MKRTVLLIGVGLALVACDQVVPTSPDATPSPLGENSRSRLNSELAEQEPVISETGEYVVYPTGEPMMAEVASTINQYAYTPEFEFVSASTDYEPETPWEASEWLVERSQDYGGSGGGGGDPGDHEQMMMGSDGYAPIVGESDRTTSSAFSVIGRNRILKDADTYCRMVYLTTETVGMNTSRVGADAYVRVLVPGQRSWGAVMNPRQWGTFAFGSRAVRLCSRYYASANIDTTHMGWNWLGMRTSIWGSVYSPRV